MSVAFTFGSFGDIIAICQIAVNLGHALGVGTRAAGGSSREYQHLRNDLDNFVRILIDVTGTYEQREQSPWLDGLAQSSEAAVGECMTAITELLGRLERKYHDSLGSGASSGKLQSVYRKFEWAIKEKEQVRDLRQLLCKNTQRLSLLVALATQMCNRVDKATLHERIDEVDKHISAQHKEILGIMRAQALEQTRQTTQLDEIGTQVVEQKHFASRAFDSIQRTFVAVVEVKDMISNLTQAVVDVQLLLSDFASLRFLDPTREQEVMLEDSLGEVFPIPAKWLDKLDWDALHVMLECRFRGATGHAMVKQKEYALEESCRGNEIPKNKPLAASLRRGMRINMAMLFPSTTEISSCPRCGVPALGQPGQEIKCQTDGCDMIVRWVVVQDSGNTGRTFFTVHSQQGGIANLQPAAEDVESQPFIDLATTNPADFRRVRFTRIEPRRAIEREEHPSLELCGTTTTVPESRGRPIQRSFSPPDDVVPKDSPLLQAYRPSLRLSPSPPPRISISQSPPPSDHFHSRRRPNRRPKGKPAQGDAVLLAFMDRYEDPTSFAALTTGGALAGTEALPPDIPESSYYGEAEDSGSDFDEVELEDLVD